uniref:Uncharacterized protein n=1 Tax=Lepeophtheirus salmonis TaxID=72036 RepID=A0A0K2TTG6_LEPSM
MFGINFGGKKVSCRFYADDNYIFLEGASEEELYLDIRSNKTNLNIMTGCEVVDHIKQLGITFSSLGTDAKYLMEKMRKIECNLKIIKAPNMNFSKRVCWWNFYVSSKFIYCS